MRKYIKKSISFILITVLVACGFSGCSQKKKTEEKEIVKESNVSVEKILSSKISSAENGDKKETVYVEMDAEGTVLNTTVSDILSVSATENISDYSTLENIVNLSGDESFSQDDNGNIIWENKGKDITYQGTTTKEAPIGIDIKYTLDGKEISAEKLVGKSGNVTISYTYQNKIKEEGEEYVPFLVLTGMVLGEQFTNVEVTNGKVIETNDKKVVVGYSLPGLKEYLLQNIVNAKKYIGDIELPQTVTVCADVTDFSMEMTLSVATSQIGDLDITDTLDFSKVQNQMNQLEGGVFQLVGGTKQLDNGARKLKEGSLALKNGADKIKNGTVDLSFGTSKLLKNYKLFHQALTGGTSELNKGAESLYDGSKILASGVKSAENGTKKLASGLKEAKGAFENTKDSVGLVRGADAVSNGITDVKGGVNELVGTLTSTPDTLQAQIDSIIAQVSEKTGGAISTKEALYTTMQAIEQAVKGGYPLETVLTNNGLNVTSYYSLLQAYYSVQTLDEVQNTFATQIMGKSAEIQELVAGLDELENGSKALSEGIKKLYEGIKQLLEGAEKLSDEKEGIPALTNGANELKNGLNTMYSGTTKMNGSVGKNSKKIVKGIEKLNGGAGKLKKGSNTLASGAGELDDGIASLVGGTKTLKDGVLKLNNEGIGKITKIFKEDAPKAIDVIEKILNNGKNYRSFSGINDEMTGSVKFVFKTQEIKAE